MLDIKFVRENPELVKENIRKKFQNAKLPLVDEAIALGYTELWQLADFFGVTESFMRKITYQELTRGGLEALAPTITAMAEAEGLDAHANAVRIRTEGGAR